MAIICFDTETTGLRAGDDEILTISIVDENGSAVFDGQFKPEHKTSWPSAQKINGIAPENVENCPSIRSFVPLLQGIFGGASAIIGYNVGFDLKFMNAIGVTPNPNAEIVDAMEEFSRARSIRSDRHESRPRRYKLSEAAAFIGHEWSGNAHSSLADARATLAVHSWSVEALSTARDA